ncbi:hypothetical protein AMAG_05058 [Allomyces macrogynus ATCC 38327]|uniref:GST C-terminal domain-containing protein n=1 Tax=Allomyces macrogynus (strain ATCC 38327) TaxID=578462 RepID=A0A0L0S746_ALLM3|nr:hypothetical protein AMAG_05058 [Allomyces macrogynus ATCC 38327]|eukprot:KNE58250.1 hypothetical protein AMAG_05058 [Allomyces macrogynus ATCC 38327]
MDQDDRLDQHDVAFVSDAAADDGAADHDHADATTTLTNAADDESTTNDAQEGDAPRTDPADHNQSDNAHDRSLNTPNPLRALASHVRSAIHAVRTIPVPALALLPPLQPVPSPASSTPTLYVHRPRWPRQKNAWASSDPECLVWQAYLQFSGIPYALVLVDADNAAMSPTGRLPFLVTERGRVVALRDRLLRYIATKAHSDEVERAIAEAAQRGTRPTDLRVLTPDDLPGPPRALAHLYLALIEADLWPALMFNWWLEPRNGLSAMRLLYAPQKSAWPAVLDTLLVAGMRQHVQADLATRFAGEIPRAEQLYAKAADALAALAERLGDGPYFFGDAPSFLDALCFAALHSILSADFPCDRLRGLVLAHDNLFTYSKNIWNAWFRKCEMSVRPIRRCGVDLWPAAATTSASTAAAAGSPATSPVVADDASSVA